LLLATGVQMVFGELVPKNIALVATCQERAVAGHSPTGIHEGDASAECPSEPVGEPAIAPRGVEPVEELRSGPHPDEWLAVVV
jgi:hypothetical protein